MRQNFETGRKIMAIMHCAAKIAIIKFGAGTKRRQKKAAVSKTVTTIQPPNSSSVNWRNRK